MVDVNILLIFIMTLAAIIGICAVVVIINIIGLRYKKQEADEERKHELIKIKIDYDIKLKEFEANKIITTKKEEDKKDMPGNASEEETKAWFDLLADPFKLTEDKKEV